MPKNFKTKMKKGVALKKLQDLIDRIEYWNKHYATYFKVQSATLVGSLARNQEVIGDIDVCMQVQRAKEFSAQENKESYIEWRKSLLGYAPPRDYNAQLNMYELDVTRYVKNRDGRIEILRNDQLGPISLTMNPISSIVNGGSIISSSASEVVMNALPITNEKAIELINSGIPRRPAEAKGEYWNSYCCSLSRYSDVHRELILKRDNYLSNFQAENA
ncbi:hypothetical protein [Saccharospirillum salsuginis]|uniref:Nucleotidyltransferase domain-containing protein n=1 Tax=Saccharospirillum salsuginis TaxID=418750 RepID=A0A918KG63_9GAMM|nr:hypothetical protein [Saccharospirillum salsuginis]GGX62476.1 hypothetical protein GCM10007392_32970 [Saccharospirillum salsuginis]